MSGQGELVALAPYGTTKLRRGNLKTLHSRHDPSSAVVETKIRSCNTLSEIKQTTNHKEASATAWVANLGGGAVCQISDVSVRVHGRSILMTYPGELPQASFGHS